MSDQARAGAVLYAKDPARLSAFYAGALGLEVAHREDDHVLATSSAFELVVLAIPTPIAATIEITAPPSRREDTPIKLVFPVASIGEVRAAAIRHSVIDPPDREWANRGARVCDGHDPEGNVVQFRERVR